MYKIFADDTLIYDSTIEDYKIGKGQISLETNKSGSFVFSVYPDHFYYDDFVKLKTVITVYKSNKIVFRGRILNDVTDYQNNKVLTCEGELGFLQDSIIRPFSFTGSPTDLFKKFINEHNSQVDDFKQFKIGNVTVADNNDYINRANSAYETTFDNLNSRLIEDSLGGYFYITHGKDGTDLIPTINYLYDFEKIATQTVEFGANLKDYTKTVKAEDIATAIIPLGATVNDNDDSTEDKKLTIADVNNGVDYVYNSEAVKKYGWIFKQVEWSDVTDASNLKAKAEDYLQTAVNQNITIELNAIDLHLLDKSIESFNVGDYIQVISEPHNFNSTMLCNKQTIDLLKPENDTLTLGHTYSAFTESNGKIQSTIQTISNKANSANTIASTASQNASIALENVNNTTDSINKLSTDIGDIWTAVNENTDNITINKANIEVNSEALKNIPTVTTVTTIGSRNSSYVGAWSGRIDVTTIGSVKHATAYFTFTTSSAIPADTAVTLATINSGYRPIFRTPVSGSFTQAQSFIKEDGTINVYSESSVAKSTVLYIAGTWIIS